MEKNTKKKATVKPQEVAGTEEQAQRMAEMKTQGRAGCQMQRINMAYTPDNLQFLRVVSASMGITMTQLNNAILNDYQKRHPEILQKAAEVVALVEKAEKDHDTDTD